MAFLLPGLLPGAKRRMLVVAAIEAVAESKPMDGGSGMAGVGTRRSVCMLAYEGIEMLDVIGPLEAFATASSLAGGAYVVEIAAERRGLVRASSGLCVEAARDLSAPDPIDTLLVSGGAGVETACLRSGLVDWIRAAAAGARRIGSVCTGAMLLAEAGLLDGRRAATHWNWCDRLAARYPQVRIERDPIFLRDGAVWTSAGVTAGMDLALAMIEEDHGPELALRTARELVMFLKRPGGQAQFSAELQAQGMQTRTPPVARIRQWVLSNLTADLSVAALADRATMSPRNFTRVFTAETGIPPAAFVERARLQRAQRLLEGTPLSVERVAQSSGFASGDVMRRVFLRHLGVSPMEYRDRFSTAHPTAPSPRTGEDPHAPSG
jgi:transcriptional regulator GlxA family with amidase domain